MRQGRQAGGERGAAGDAHGGVQRGGDHRGQPRGRHDRRGAAHAPERLDLHHDQVRGPGGRDGERVLGLADRLVRGDRGGDAPGAQLRADLREVGDAGHGLLRVLEADVGQRGEHVDGLGGRPAGVGVDADLRVGQQRAHPPHAGQVGLAAAGDETALGSVLGHLDLDRGDAVAVAGQDGLDVVRGHRGHGGVDGDRLADRGGPALPAGLDRGGQPRGALVRTVLRERGELGPARRAAQQQGVAQVRAAEPHAHRQGDRDGVGQQLLDARQGGTARRAGQRGQGGGGAHAASVGRALGSRSDGRRRGGAPGAAPTLRRRGGSRGLGPGPRRGRGRRAPPPGRRRRRPSPPR